MLVKWLNEITGEWIPIEHITYRDTPLGSVIIKTTMFGYDMKLQLVDTSIEEKTDDDQRGYSRD